MAKKDFKGDNPALAFITMPDDQPAKEKKTTQKSASGGKPPKGYKPDPAYIETKSRRVQLLMQPSIADAARQYAADKGISMNELAAIALKEYLDKYSK